MSPKYWDRHQDADRQAFTRFLEPLVVAAWPSKVQREKNFGRAEASVYLLTLQDVPREILALGVTRLLQLGVTWMPKPGDIKHACADIVEERRSVAAREASRIQDECVQCQHSRGFTWVSVNGVPSVDRCECWHRAQTIMAKMEMPLARPALPAHDSGDAA